MLHYALRKHLKRITVIDDRESPDKERVPWDHSTHDAFSRYYEEEHRSDRTVRRFAAIRDIVLRAVARDGELLEVLDVGCGPGTQSLLWAERGHRIHGLDVSERFISVARQRSDLARYAVDFRVGSAASLPWPTGTMDICLAVELLEHIAEWEQCLDEFTRVLRPGGALFLTTTNALCPKQQEFDLPFYSWYPGRLKRRYEHLAKTTRPELASFATYPAVNWFTFYGLRKELARRGCRSYDRLDVVNASEKTAAKRVVIRLARALPPVRFLAHVATPSTWILAIKN
jgi:2-polyprenyl-3-methyl-5-hydroxy-6-metoxy-1,4-benzoquinol methylase